MLRSTFPNLVIILLALSLSSCASTGFNDSAASSETVWIDVRAVEEYRQDHIEGDMNVPLQAMSAASLSSLNIDSDADIRLYCGSGVRAGQAQAIFEQAGFSNVSNAGGISNVREARKINQ